MAKHVCTLSVLAQISIDNCKRAFDIDLNEEIKRIKEDMNIGERKYPMFWKTIKRGFNKKNINPEIECPMNYLATMELPFMRYTSNSIPMSHFFIKYPLEKDRKQSKKVEELISNYSLAQLNHYSDDYTEEDMLVDRTDFDELIKAIRETYISTNYMGLMSWLIDRAFMITPKVVNNVNANKSVLNKNKATLLKVLYEVDRKSFLKCFDKGETEENKEVFDPTK